MFLEIEEIENEPTSGSDTGGSVGTDSGSASGSGGSRSNGSANGSGGNANGSGGNVDGSGSGNGSEFSGNDSADNGSDNVIEFGRETINNVESTNRVDNVVNSRSERIRRRKPIRLGSADRDRDTDTDDRDGSGSADETEFPQEPVIRLGARPKAKPKAKVEADNETGELKLSEMKDLISMFLGSIFEIPAATLRQDHWRLSKEENKILTDALVSWLKSMPKSRSNKVAQFITENLPILNLLMVGFFILSDRVRTSIAIAQVTKSGRIFETTARTETPRNSPISTPLDAMFS